MSVRILGWARPAGYNEESSHGVVSVDAHSSVVTACNGRWATCETHDFVWGVDAAVDSSKKSLNKCVACLNAAGLARTRDSLADFVQVASADEFFGTLAKTRGGS